MFKTIFVPMNGSDQDTVALGTAIAVAELFESHLECARVSLAPELLVWEGDLIDVAGGAIEGELVTHLEKKDRELTTKAQRTFKRFCEAKKIAIADTPGPVGVTARWQEMRGHPVPNLVAEARFHDLVVVARDLLMETDPASDFVGDMVLGSGRPVLLARHEAPPVLGRSIAIAWKNTPEAARAVTAAMPLLGQAETVHVLSTNDGSESDNVYINSSLRLATNLRWNGCKAVQHHVEPKGNPAQAVLAHARALGADLFVTGGYGHSRAREVVFGGFTHVILRDSPLPVLMAH
jgi:nucleotide-binding universal stress UspA family protein